MRFNALVSISEMIPPGVEQVTNGGITFPSTQQIGPP